MALERLDWGLIVTAALPPSSLNNPVTSPEVFVDEEDLGDLTMILDPNPPQAETAEDLDLGDTSDIEEVVNAQDNLNHDEDDNDSAAVNLAGLNLTIEWNVPVGRPPHFTSPSAHICC